MDSSLHLIHRDHDINTTKLVISVRSEVVLHYRTWRFVLATLLFVRWVVKDDTLTLIATNILPVGICDRGTSANEVIFVDVTHVLFKSVLHGLVCDNEQNCGAWEHAGHADLGWSVEELP